MIIKNMGHVEWSSRRRQFCTPSSIGPNGACGSFGGAPPKRSSFRGVGILPGALAPDSVANFGSSHNAPTLLSIPRSTVLSTPRSDRALHDGRVDGRVGVLQPLCRGSLSSGDEDRRGRSFQS